VIGGSGGVVGLPDPSRRPGRIVLGMLDESPAVSPTPTLARSPLRIAPWEPRWAIRAAELVTDIAARIGPVAQRLDHIGSTSIAGMAAKPVYDLQVSVLDLDATAPVIDRAVEPLGLVRYPWQQDHIPAGRDDLPGQWVKRFWGNGTPGGERINLHARLVGSQNERLALLFRDWFRAHPESIPAYAAFKRALAPAVADIDTYADVKDPVVDLVISVAETWALESGWTVR
jgi:GrpB-like predicted nucleotidyltransferase (UPF0157 family)